MPSFGGRSMTVRATLHPSLVAVVDDAIKTTDFMLIQGSRTQQEQEADFLKGTTKAHWGQSAHDFNPSFAVDCAPIPLVWNDLGAFHTMATYIKQSATRLGISITWGGDWVSIKDYPHIELSNWRNLA